MPKKRKAKPTTVTLKVEPWLASEIAAALRNRAAFHTWDNNKFIAARLMNEAASIEARIAKTERRR